MILSKFRVPLGMQEQVANDSQYPMPQFWPVSQ